MPVAEAPARPNPSAEDETFWAAWDDFFAAIRRVRGRAARELGAGLTISQFHLLNAVDQCPEAGLRELGERVGSSPPTITRMLSTLERAGIVERLPHPDGPRRLRVRITEHGRELLAAKTAAMNTARAAVFASLTPAERAQVQSLMPRLTDALDAL